MENFIKRSVTGAKSWEVRREYKTFKSSVNKFRWFKTKVYFKKGHTRQNITKVLLILGRSMVGKGSSNRKFSLSSKSSAIESALQRFDWPRGDNFPSREGRRI